jgi:hypothetical protein
LNRRGEASVGGRAHLLPYKRIVSGREHRGERGGCREHPADLPDRREQVWLRTTDNAGFGGIEASITTEDGRELYHLPLGEFTIIDPAVTDTIPVN